MMDSRVNYVMVGGFVLAALVALVLALALVAGRGGATDGYTVVYQNVTGVVPGTEVLFEGFPVGRVTGIEPLRGEEKRRFQVELTLRKDWPVPEDSTAEITAPGLLAAFAIEIHSGSSEVLLAPGSEITARAPGNVFVAVSNVASELQELIRVSIRPVLDGFATSTPGILENLEVLSAELAQAGERVGAVLGEENANRVGDILENFHTTSENVAAVSRDLAETERELHALLAGLNELVAENQGQVGESVSDLRLALESVARHIDAITYNLEGTSRNMNELTLDLRKNPGLLLRGRSDGEASP